MKAQSTGDTISLDYMKGRRVFEINPDHSIIKNINVKSPFIITCTWLL